MWHMTRDMGHVTCDTWHMTHIVEWTFSPNVSAVALPVWDWECLEDILTKGWVNQWVSDGGDCRTALATPGLLIMTHEKPVGTLVTTIAIYCTCVLTLEPIVVSHGTTVTSLVIIVVQLGTLVVTHCTTVCFCFYITRTSTSLLCIVGRLCLLVELHLVGSATNKATSSRFY